MVVGITYTDKKMTISANLCVKSMTNNGVDKTGIFGPEIFIDEGELFKGKQKFSDSFGVLNSDILLSERGAGYWLWKPFVISNFMAMHMNDGDILIYSDAGCEWIADVNEIIKAMDQDLFLFTSGHLQREWCKGDVLQLICPYSPPDQLQVQASVIFIRVNDYTRRFIKEWLLWCQMPGLIDDSPSVIPNHPDFKEHRHDQAILSALATRDNIKLHWWPDAIWFQNQRHRWPEDKYPPMLKHHRKRNSEW